MNLSLLKTILLLTSTFFYVQLNATTTSIDNEIDLSLSERRVYSQNGEDGVLEKIFELTGVTNKYYIEFGAYDGITASNIHNLRTNYGWFGLQLDGGFENHELNLKQEFLTAENVLDLFEKYQVPEEFDLISIDIDFNDFYLWNTICEKYHPRVIVIEYNATHLPDEDKVVVYHPQFSGDGCNYFGASIKAFYNLGRSKGYSLVYADKGGVNLFFIRDDVIETSGLVFKNVNNVKAIYQTPKYGSGPNGGHFQDPYYREYCSSEDILLPGDK